MPIYLYAAVLCYMAYKNKYIPFMYYIGITVYTSYAAFLFFDKSGVLSWAGEHHAQSLVQSMKADRPWIEETREFGGLMLILMSMFINLAWLKKQKEKQQPKAFIPHCFLETYKLDQ
jgi:hypothetical protein